MTRTLHEVYMPFSSGEYDTPKTFLVEAISEQAISAKETVRITRYHEDYEGSLHEEGTIWLNLDQAVAIKPREFKASRFGGEDE